MRSPGEEDLMLNLERRLKKLTYLTVCGLLICWAAAVSSGQSRFHGNSEARPYTLDLPPIDKVELIKLTTNGDLWNGEIEAVKVLEGVATQDIATLWRSQTYLPYSAICHLPAYAIRFYEKDKVILYATLCWQCDNIRFELPKLKATQGFGGRDRKGQKLLAVFRKAFQESKRKKMRTKS